MTFDLIRLKNDSLKILKMVYIVGVNKHDPALLIGALIVRLAKAHTTRVEIVFSGNQCNFLVKDLAFVYKLYGYTAIANFFKLHLNSHTRSLFLNHATICLHELFKEIYLDFYDQLLDLIYQMEDDLELNDLWDQLHHQLSIFFKYKYYSWTSFKNFKNQSRYPEICLLDASYDNHQIRTLLVNELVGCHLFKFLVFPIENLLDREVQWYCQTFNQSHKVNLLDSETYRQIKGIDRLKGVTFSDQWVSFNCHELAEEYAHMCYEQYMENTTNKFLFLLSVCLLSILIAYIPFLLINKIDTNN